MVKDQEDEYRLAFEIVDNRAHIYVYEPIITKEERDKRMLEVKEAFRVFWEDYYRREAIRVRNETRLARST